MYFNKIAIIVAIVTFTVFSGSVVPVMAVDMDEQADTMSSTGVSGQPATLGDVKPIVPSPRVSERPAIVGEAQAYTLGKEDVVQIIVRNQPEFSGQYVIGPDGKIQYAFVGDIEAAGSTKQQLKKRLLRELERFVKGPEVSVAIVGYNSKNVYVLGEVGSPGKYPMKGDVITLREALVSAGLPTRAAAVRRVYIIKFVENKPVFKKADIFRLFYKGDMKHNIKLVTGDIIVVPTTVPHELNRALNTLLGPVFKAAAVDALLDRN